MAKTKQFNITVQNQAGTVLEIARVLGNAKVNILSLLGTAQGTTGTVQVVAEDARRAQKALDGAGIAYEEAVAEVVELSNKAGALADVLEKVKAKGASLSSVHATAAKGGRNAVVVYTVEAASKAAAATA
jgi:hypothetical protein